MQKKIVSVLINILITVLIAATALIFLFAQLSRAVEIEQCQGCHATVKPMKPPLTKDCLNCHSNHDSGQPTVTDPDSVHGIHSHTLKPSARSCGSTCHLGIITCTNCHNFHERGNKPQKGENDSIGNITLQYNNVNITNCISCHGQLPQPKGHDNFRNALSVSKHKWMNCRTCHINDNNFELHFKDLLSISINDSINLCKICHSLQYNELKEGRHGAGNKTCIDCHNPHTTQFSGPNFQIIPKITPTINLSTSIDTTMGNTRQWLVKNIPMLNNPIAVFIIILVIVITISEIVLSNKETGTKIVHNMVKIQENDDILKTLEIRLKNNEINSVNDILERNGVHILGMTMSKEEGKERASDIFKYVIFIDVTKPKTFYLENFDKNIDLEENLDENFNEKFDEKFDRTFENTIKNEILSELKDNVKSFNLTDKYEL